MDERGGICPTEICPRETRFIKMTYKIAFFGFFMEKVRLFYCW